jgi:tetratricopeptide (TPR) repeat protein
LFIPSVGFVFFATAVMFHFLKNPPARFSTSLMMKKPVIYLTCLLPVFLIQDWSRNSDWKDEITLFEHDAKYLERSAGANNLLANKYAEFLYTGDPRYPQQALIEKCLEHYRLASAADSSVYTALNNAGSVIFRYKNDPELALKYFLGSVRVHPDYPQAYENMGDCYLALGKKKEAAAAYQRSIEQNEKQFRAYLQLASIRMDAGEYDQALSVLRKAQINFPPSYAVLERIGTCNYQKGERQKGLQQLEEAYNLSPNKELAQKLFLYFSEEKQPQKADLYKEAVTR